MINYYITLASNLSTLVFYIVSFFLIIGIRRRTDEKLSSVWRYLMIALANIIVARILSISIVSELLTLPIYIKEFFIFLFALFFMMAAADFYRYMVDFTKTNLETIKKEEKCHIIREVVGDGLHKKISGLYKKKLQKMEDKIRQLEGRAEKGNVKESEVSSIGNKLGLQLSLLDKSYRQGYISRDSYLQGKRRIGKVYENLKKKHL